MKCQKCDSPRVININSKSSDLNCVYTDDVNHDGYVPTGIGIDDGTGDYIVFAWCLNCGQIQGEFPLPISDFEMGEEDDDE